MFLYISGQPIRVKSDPRGTNVCTQAHLNKPFGVEGGGLTTAHSKKHQLNYNILQRLPY